MSDELLELFEQAKGRVSGPVFKNASSSINGLRQLGFKTEEALQSTTVAELLEAKIPLGVAKDIKLLFPLPAASTSQYNAVPAGVVITEELLRQVIREEVGTEGARKPKPFSQASTNDALGLLDMLGIGETNGNAMEPLQLPADCPDCKPFDYSQYCDEKAGTAALLHHHEEQLKKMGVKFGRGGYEMYDLHNKGSLFTISKANQSYSGNIDGSLSPFGLADSYAARQCRIAFEHKQSSAQKQAYRERHPEVPQPFVHDGTSGSVSLSACKGLAITAFIGAYAYNVFPLILDLTDGEVHHLLQLEGDELYEWTNLTPQQAYFKMSLLLQANNDLLIQRRLTLEAIPEELQAPMKKMRTLRPPSGLQEQLDSIIPGIEGRAEKLQATFELINAWSQREELEMPMAARAMYGW